MTERDFQSGPNSIETQRRILWNFRLSFGHWPLAELYSVNFSSSTLLYSSLCFCSFACWWMTKWRNFVLGNLNIKILLAYWLTHCDCEFYDTMLTVILTRKTTNCHQTNMKAQYEYDEKRPFCWIQLVSILNLSTAIHNRIAPSLFI